jgi:hypothetical protein
MKRSAISLALALLTLAPAVAVENGARLHVTPPALPYPVPTGAPDFVIGGGSHAPITLRYAIIHGRRVLYDAESGDVVYVLGR